MEIGFPVRALSRASRLGGDLRRHSGLDWRDSARSQEGYEMAYPRVDPDPRGNTESGRWASDCAPIGCCVTGR